jgi:hypothetical protein
MAGLSKIRTIIAAGVIVITSAGGLAAQQVIRLDNDVCMRGLKALGETLQADIKITTPPRKIAGTCRAQKLRLRGGGVDLEIGDIQWPSGTLIALETGKVPESLNLSMTRVRVIKAPADTPVWAFLKAQSAGSKRMDVNLGLRYKPEDSELIIQQAYFDFQNGNSISLRARMGGVSADIPQNPAVSAAGYSAKRIELRLTSGRTSVNPALAAIRDAIEQKMEQDELGGQDFKRTLKTLASKVIGPFLDAADMVDLKRLINDAPRARDDIVLQMNSANGFAVAQMAFIKPEDRLAAVLEGFEVSFAYGPRAH